MKQLTKTTGGCLCGAVRYAIRGEVHLVYNCHCVDCRRASAAPYVSWVFCKQEVFEILQGTPSEIEHAGRVRTFCSNCGTPLTFKNPQYPDDIDVTACSLDDPALFPPKGHLWVEDKVSWIELNDGLPQFERFTTN